MEFLTAITRAARISVTGFWTMLRTERSSKIQLTIVILGIIVGFWLQISREEWLAVIIVSAMLLSLEAVNTAIEAVVDLVSPEYHDLAKRAKDVAAGAVFPAALAGALVAALIILPRLTGSLAGA